MNTPEPCDTCKHLYYDPLYEDDPDCLIECKLGNEMGNKDCPDYLNWKETD